MSQKKLAPQEVVVTAERGGLKTDETKAARIANAISPAVANFNCAGLKMPMGEEPSRWTQLALAGARK